MPSPAELAPTTIAELRRHVADFKERYGEHAVIYLAALFPNPS
jgi:hypothetical protein